MNVFGIPLKPTYHLEQASTQLNKHWSPLTVKKNHLMNKIEYCPLFYCCKSSESDWNALKASLEEIPQKWLMAIKLRAWGELSLCGQLVIQKPLGCLSSLSTFITRQLKAWSQLYICCVNHHFIHLRPCSSNKLKHSSWC